MDVIGVISNALQNGYASTELGTMRIASSLLFAAAIGLYIFCCYRWMTRKAFYSRTFNITLVGITLVTASIILTIQASIVVSLGMVGALSIVRFRTAVKDPMDLLFLFWAISSGISCGAGIAEVAVMSSLILTIVLLLLSRTPVREPANILSVTLRGDADPEAQILPVIRRACRVCTERSRIMKADHTELLLEIRARDTSALLKDLRAADGVMAVTLLSHDGEVVF